MFEYELTRSNRRTLSVKITRDASIKVSAPKRMSVREIESFLVQKQSWIEKHLAEMRKRQESVCTFIPDENSKLLLLGEEYPLRKIDSKKAGFDGKSFYLPKTVTDSEAIPELKDVYRSIAKDYLKKRTYELAQSYGESVNSVKINSARTRWGSCTSKGNINFSLFLIMAPPQAIDYCIIHELSHLRQMNHSKAFWTLVESRDPNYRAHKEELNKLQYRLSYENW